MPARTRDRRRRPVKPEGSLLSPVLLLGAGTGEATCGILYLASYLRRNGVEAFVRIHDDDETEAQVTRSLEQLLAHVRPRLVGLSLKWFHHVARARLLARTLRRLDPRVRIVLGGNTAAWWWRQVAAWDCVDAVVLGDGEAPLLALCRGEAAPPNVVTRSAGGAFERPAALGYVQGPSSDDVFYSHFDDVFLSQLDRHSFSGWIAPGKGCAENCLYCGGARGVQQASFGRATEFLRSVASVRLDHLELAPRTWQLRYDFGGGSGPFLERAWHGVDLSRHATTYFLWGVPPPGLVETLSGAFQRVFMVLDVGCFSQAQRQALRRMGLLKPCPTDAELLDVVEAVRRHANVQLEVSGIAGLPLASEATLAEERRLVPRLLAEGCLVGYQRLEAQPGALVTEHPARFGMATEARTFEGFLDSFERRGPAGDGTVPMVHFAEPALEAAVQRTAEELGAAVHEAALGRAVKVDRRTRLVNTSTARRFGLADWLGPWVPARVAKEPVTVVRSVDGQGLSCAPTLDARRFESPALQPGEQGAALLAALDAFARPTAVEAAVAQLRTQARLDAQAARGVVEQLVEGRFLQPA